MNFELGIFALCASAGVAGGILLGSLKVFERHQGVVVAAAVASFITVCVLDGELSILPHPTLRAWSSLAIHFAPGIALPFLAAWTVTFIGRRFLADVRVYLDERQFGSMRERDIRDDGSE